MPENTSLVRSSARTKPPRTLALAAVVASIATVTQLQAAELFPFVPPWDDASPSILDVSGWLEKPAGKHGFIAARDGHLFAGPKRIRFFGVNTCFGGNFPRKQDAGKIAARMAKFGINCVRFHHLDMQTTPGGIFAKDGRTFDPEQLDRLDYFIAELKKRGIYVNLNLHVSRTYPDRPKSEKEGNSNFDKGVDNFSAKMIEMQRDYARTLLTHVNPYTKNAYVAEPAVAFVEINNENGLLDEWHGGRLDKIAAPYREELSALWTQWLRVKYPDDEKLSAAWSSGARAAGEEMLKNGNFAAGAEGWTLEQHHGAAARAEVVVADSAGDEANTPRGSHLRIEVQTPGRERWHVQFGQAGLRLKAGESYELSFQARAAQPREMTVAASQADDPWGQIASMGVTLGPSWSRTRFFFQASADEENARIMFTSLGGETGVVELADVSLRTSAREGTARRDSAGRVAAFTKGELAGRTEAAQRDWFTFLWETEEKYWSGMYRFLREELKTRSPIIGTQLGWSPFPIQQQMDVIDSHAYWQHPHFPGRSWDPNNWTVKNVSMAGAPDGGTLGRLAMQRVAGKPYVCTEYNHSAPNTFSSEAFPLISAFAALQDWDGVFAFAYSHRRDDWDKGYFGSYFDIDQHPTKWATLPASAALFVREDLQPAANSDIATVTVEAVRDQTRKSGPRLHAGQFGVKMADIFTKRVGLGLGTENSVDESKTLVFGGKANAEAAPGLRWDLENRVAIIDTGRSKGIVGSLKKRTFELGDVTITAGETQQNWATIQLTAMDGADFQTARRLLVTATGYTENTGMKWQDAEKSTVGRNWGSAPSLVEGIAATIQLPAGRTWKAWALDERGQRRAEVPVNARDLKLGPEHQTLWYEVASD